VRALAASRGIRPKKSLGQHFLIEPALARRIVELAEVGPTSRVLEIGAGLGSLTVELARTGARVVAMELDARLAEALRDVVGEQPRVDVLVADALTVDWSEVLSGGPWVVVANLPYNVGVPVIMRILDREPRVKRMLVMVQKELGDRLAARPGESPYGALSVRVAYRAEARVIRPVSRSVFWPPPNVDSVLVSLTRRPPPVDVVEADLWRTIEVAFEQRRKTIRGALLRLGLDAVAAADTLAACGIDRRERPERLSLGEFACLAGRWPRALDPTASDG